MNTQACRSECNYVASSLQVCKSEYTANIEGFSCYTGNAYANVKTSKPAIVTVRFPLVKTMMYAVSVLMVLAIAKPFLF